MKNDPRLICLYPSDNVLVCTQKMTLGEQVLIEGQLVKINANVDLGHKVARCNINKRDKIMKYGSPIGSATCDINCGEHVHMHNVKSDYIASHTRDRKGVN